MRFFALSFDKVVLRFYLMMGVVIGGIFAGQAWTALLALPIFLSCALGLSFRPEPTAKKIAKRVDLPATATGTVRVAA